jgi:hypothetical protein
VDNKQALAADIVAKSQCIYVTAKGPFQESTLRSYRYEPADVSGVSAIIDTEDQYVLVLPTLLSWPLAGVYAGISVQELLEAVSTRRMEELEGRQLRIQNLFELIRGFSWYRHTICEFVLESPEGNIVSSHSNHGSFDNPEGLPSTILKPRWDQGGSFYTRSLILSAESHGVELVDERIRRWVMEGEMSSRVHVLSSPGELLFSADMVGLRRSSA